MSGAGLAAWSCHPQRVPEITMEVSECSSLVMRKANGYLATSENTLHSAQVPRTEGTQLYLHRQ